VFFISRLRILQVSPLATLQTHHLRHHIDIDHLRLHNSHRTGKTYWTLHSSLLSINPWVFDAPLSSNLDPESPRSDCGSTAGASTNRSILQSEKRPKIILNTYSEGFFGAAYGYRLFFWTILLSLLGGGLEVTVKGPRAKLCLM